MKAFQVRDDVGRAFVGRGGELGGRRQDLSQEPGSLTLLMMKQIKTKLHPPHPNASGRKGERETSKETSQWQFFLLYLTTISVVKNI